MRHLLNRAALAALTVAVAWPVAPAMAEGEFNAVGSFKLPGDLEVVTSESHTLKKVTVDTWVAAGSAQDFTGYPGLADATAVALWEYGAKPLSQALTNLGGTSHLEVTRDATHFSVTLPSDKLAEGMDLVGATFANPNWSGLDLGALRARLASDAAAAMAAPGRQSVETLLASLYGPDYGHRVSGQPEAIARFTAADLQAFYDRHYVPATMKVVLVGDFGTGTTVGQVVRSYAAFLKRTASGGPALSRPLAASPERKPSGADAQLAAGARGPAMGDMRDLATMAMLANVIGAGEKSRLATALGDKARSLKAEWMPFKGPGALVIQVATAPANTMEVEKVVRDLLGDLRTNPVTLDEHARAANAIVRAYDATNDTLAEQAATLGFFATVGGSPHQARIYPEIVRQVSRNDMFDAAQKYLTPDAVKVVVQTP